MHKKIRQIILVVCSLVICLLITSSALALATEKEKENLNNKALHINYSAEDQKGYGSADYLYQPIIITGNQLPEEIIFNVKDLEEIAVFNKFNLPLSATFDNQQYYGINLLSLLNLCGLGEEAADDTVIQIWDINNKLITLNLQTLKNNPQGAMIAFSSNGLPLVENQNSLGYDKKANNANGPLLLKAYDANNNLITMPKIKKILVSKAGNLVDPNYGMHNRAPHDGMQSIKFTVNLFDKNDTNQEQKPFKTTVFTLKEIEQMMLDNPDHVYGNYFGTFGDRESVGHTGVGGFLDYFRGLDMWWLLTEKAGVNSNNGYAIFYDRENKEYARVKSLEYFIPTNNDYSKYNVAISRSLFLNNVRPIIATTKNGYPILAEHEHESGGYVDYNKVNAKLLAAGMKETKVGLVKNHSGPFIAGLPNYNDIYGGYRNYTGGGCIGIDIYLDKEANDRFSLEAKNFIKNKQYIDSNGNYMSRGEFFAKIAELCKVDQIDQVISFKDISQKDSYFNAVNWAYQQGLTKGIGNNLFAPKRLISQEEAKLTLQRMQ